MTDKKLKEYRGVKLKYAFVINYKCYVVMRDSSSTSAVIRATYGNYDVVHIHAEDSAAIFWLSKFMEKRVVVTIYRLEHQRFKCGCFVNCYAMQAEKNAVKYTNGIIRSEQKCPELFQRYTVGETIYISNGMDRKSIRFAD